MGADCAAGEVDALVKRMDVDQDGKVSYPEFVRWFNTAQDNALLMGAHDATAVAQIVTAGTSGRPYASGFFYDWATHKIHYGCMVQALQTPVLYFLMYFKLNKVDIIRYDQYMLSNYV